MTCRLGALGVPFGDVDIDADPAAARRVASLNHGNLMTPVIVGDDAAVQAEPNARDRTLLMVRAHELVQSLTPQECLVPG